MGDHFIRHIALLGFEKRFVPSQHYVSTGRERPALGHAWGWVGGARAGPRTAPGLPARGERVQGRGRDSGSPGLRPPIWGRSPCEPSR